MFYMWNISANEMTKAILYAKMMLSCDISIAV